MERFLLPNREGTGQVFLQALLAGDGRTILRLLRDPQSGVRPNTIFDTSNLDGIWSLTYTQDLTTALHITASRGFVECLRLLLLQGADVDLAPSGQTALHIACTVANTECVRLLLSFGADPDALSEDGLRPLHLCQSPESLRCAQLLLCHGAAVNSTTEVDKDTPLHCAARLGLVRHVCLFMRFGANLEARNAEEKTPLNSACAQSHPPEAMKNYFAVCQQLVAAGANVNTRDCGLQCPLHQACKNANHFVVELLLANGAHVNSMSYSGNMALNYILQAVPHKVDHHPEQVVRTLLNYGALRVVPGALLQVLHYCCSSPRTIEVLINTYSHVQVTAEWEEAVPTGLVQRHPEFFNSLFTLGQRPRSLQHLARCALRMHLGKRLLEVLPHLGLPPHLQQFVLLRFEDILY